MFEIITKGAISGIVVSVILYLAKTGRSDVAGLLVLFPAITLLSYYFIGQAQGTNHLKDVVKHSAISMPVWLIFIGATYGALQFTDYRIALVLGLTAWIVASLIYVFLIP